MNLRKTGKLLVLLGATTVLIATIVNDKVIIKKDYTKDIEK